MLESKNSYSRKSRKTRKTKKNTQTFYYVDTKTGDILNNKKEVERINKLRIPPGYHDVVISKSEKSKIQAFGYDDKSRKQIIYSKNFRQKQQKKKHKHMITFGKVLPIIQKRINKHLKEKGRSKEKLISVVLSLMQVCNFRIGNDSYLREYGTYGLTTLECRHIKINGNKVKFSFIGKKGVLNEDEIRFDKNSLLLKFLISIKDDCKNINDSIFLYQGDDGQDYKLRSNHVNDFLKEFGKNISSKNFRTWSANVCWIDILRELDCPTNITQAKKNIVESVKFVAEELHNTPSVAKKEYINNDVIQYYLDNNWEYIHSLLQKNNDDDDVYLELLKLV